MAEEGAQVASPSKGKAAGRGRKAATAAKKAKPAPNHPIVSVMVNTAISDLKERGGSSLQAIKKYISSNYKVDADRMAPFIRKFIKKAVAEGKLVQTKGTGASGSFKMSSAADKSTKKPTTTTKKAAKPTVAKKTTTAKKTVAAKSKKTPVKKTPKAAVKKSPAKKPTPKKSLAKKPVKKPAAKKSGKTRKSPKK